MNIEQTINRSVELQDALSSLITTEACEKSDRMAASETMCSIALEHGRSLIILTEAGNYTSAISIIRLQYEILVRAMWLHYSAKGVAVSEIMDELNNESEKRASKLPMLSEMIKQLDGNAPKSAIEMVTEFKAQTWKALNSYVHGGIHAANRHNKGFPHQLTIQVIGISNALSTMAVMLLSIILNDTRAADKMKIIQLEFKDCLPELLK